MVASLHPAERFAVLLSFSSTPLTAAACEPFEEIPVGLHHSTICLAPGRRSLEPAKLARRPLRAVPQVSQNTDLYQCVQLLTEYPQGKVSMRWNEADEGATRRRRNAFVTSQSTAKLRRRRVAGRRAELGLQTRRLDV
eukprot:5561533-Pleurochrysis_carterae.AAC.3